MSEKRLQHLVLIDSYRLSELIRVSTVRIHVANRLWGAAVAKEMEKFMHAFRVADVETRLD